MCHNNHVNMCQVPNAFPIPSILHAGKVKLFIRTGTVGNITVKMAHLVSVPKTVEAGNMDRAYNPVIKDKMLGCHGIFHHERLPYFIFRCSAEAQKTIIAAICIKLFQI